MKAVFFVGKKAVSLCDDLLEELNEIERTQEGFFTEITVSIQNLYEAKFYVSCKEDFDLTSQIVKEKGLDPRKAAVVAENDVAVKKFPFLEKTKRNYLCLANHWENGPYYFLRLDKSDPNLILNILFSSYQNKR